MVKETALHLKSGTMTFSGDSTLKNRILPLLILLAAFSLLLLTAHAAVAQEGPVARITLPIRGQTLRGNLTIQGTATSPPQPS